MTERGGRRTWLLIGSLALVAVVAAVMVRRGVVASDLADGVAAEVASGDPSAAPAGSAGGATAAAATSGAAADEPFVPVDMPEPPSLPGARPAASGAEKNRGIFSDYGFPGFPDLVHLCGSRVFEPGGAQTVWDAFTTQESPETVIAHYQRWLSWRGFKADKPGGKWSLPAGAPTPSRTLQVTLPNSAGRHRSCDRKASAEAKTVIVLTRH